MSYAREKPTTRLGICLGAYVLHQFDVAGRSLGRRRENIHAGVHSARKAIRRIRATLDLGRARLWPAATIVFDELRDLCRELSAPRDAHAVIETLDDLRKQAQDIDQRELFGRIRTSLIKRHTIVVARLLRRDRGGARRFLASLHQLREATKELRWGEIDAADIRSALHRSDRRAERAADEVRQTQDGRVWHRWRRRLRRLRHQMTILETELDWRLVEHASSAEHDGISAPEWKAIVRVSPVTLGNMTHVLAQERDLRMLRNAVRSTTTIKHDDRVIALKLLRNKIDDIAQRKLPRLGIPYGWR